MRWLFGDDAAAAGQASRPFFAHEGRRHLKHRTVYTADDHAGAASGPRPATGRRASSACSPMAPTMIGGIGPPAS